MRLGSCHLVIQSLNWASTALKGTQGQLECGYDTYGFTCLLLQSKADQVALCCVPGTLLSPAGHIRKLHWDLEEGWYQPPEDISYKEARNSYTFNKSA